MFGWLKKDPLKKLQDEYYQILKEGVDSQRNGDLKRYAALTEKAESIQSAIVKLEASSPAQR